MLDRQVVLLAIAVWCGASVGTSVPRWPALAVCLGALAARRPVLLGVGATALASGLAAAAWAGLEPPPSGRVEGWAVLVGDPESVPGGVRVEVRLDGRHLDAWARGASAAAVRARSAGEGVEIRGRLRPLSPLAARHLRPRHVAARLEVAEVGRSRPAAPVGRLANSLRHLLSEGARPLGDDERSLLVGVVLGDERGRREELTDAFSASGLSHLLAVSGQNVAYVLVVAGPVLRRLGLWPRWAATLAVVVFFGLLTGWEPSVLRAGAMAAAAGTAVALGRPTHRLRLLALAVTGCLLLDPLLVHSAGFRLSVGATVGIALLAAPLAARLRGPAPVRELLAVTVAAQIGVLPVAVPMFGGVPLASVPANLLAVPAAAPLTIWGLTAGLVAGRVGPPADGLLHVPTRFLARWMAGVARWGADLPLGTFGAREALGSVLAVALLASARWRWRSARTGSTSPPGRW